MRRLLPALIVFLSMVPAAMSADTDFRTARLEADLVAARAAWLQEPTEWSAIWVGRRLGYLERYDEAIAWYLRSLERWPESHRLRRHLGHRLISARRPAEAIPVLERALDLARERPNRLEPDGAPGPEGEPRSTTHGNIDYHLALAYYLTGRFDDAAAAWERCVTRWARNDDGRVAATHWLAVSLRRAGRTDEAERAVLRVPAAADVIENFAYRDLVDLYAGRRTAADLRPAGDAPASAALRYGLARWHLHQGREQAGIALLEQLADEAPSAAFGVLAAEADLEEEPDDR